VSNANRSGWTNQWWLRRHLHIDLIN